MLMQQALWATTWCYVLVNWMQFEFILWNILEEIVCCAYLLPCSLILTNLYVQGARLRKGQTTLLVRFWLYNYYLSEGLT